MRTERIKVSGESAVYHCIARVVGGSFLLGVDEKRVFRRSMWRLAEFCGVEIITYCLMSNHVHLLVRVSDQGHLSDEEIFRRVVAYYGRREPWVQSLAQSFKRDGKLARSDRDSMARRMGDVSMFMRTLKQRFSKWYNRKHGRFGTLWAERFKSVLIEDASEAMRTVAMYIDLNPVRAGIVQDPKDYPFCGHAEAVAGKKEIRQAIIPFCEGDSWRKACGEYRRQMMVYAGESNAPDKATLSRVEVLATLRRGGKVSFGEVLRLRIRYLNDGLVFGSREYVERVFDEFRSSFGPLRTSGSRRIRMLGEHFAGLSTARDLQRSQVG